MSNTTLLYGFYIAGDRRLVGGGEDQDTGLAGAFEQEITVELSAP
jgi:hypothetical protein